MTRRLDVDLVRGLALMSMYVAHVAPTPGPGHVLELSEYLTMPLFALLVGVGAQLGARRAARSTRGARWRSLLVRAAALVVVGLALDRVGAQVVIVLVHLGVLTVVAGLLAGRSSRVVAVAGLLALLLTPLLLQRAQVQGLPYETWFGPTCSSSCGPVAPTGWAAWSSTRRSGSCWPAGG